jgi:hypothetical protein
LNKQRVERLKEISNTLHHIAKSETDNTTEILDQILPFFKQLRETEWNKDEFETWITDTEKHIKERFECKDKKEDNVIDVDVDEEEEEEEKENDDHVDDVGKTVDVAVKSKKSK